MFVNLRNWLPLVLLDYYNNLMNIFNKFYTKSYDFYFGDNNFKLSTPRLYNFSIQKLKNNSKILDFGCGNGLCYSDESIRKNIINKNLKIKGIDIDKIYINECKKRVRHNNLENNILIELLSIFDLKIDDNEEKYDYVIFCESAPVIPQPMLLEIISYIYKNLIKEDGKIIFINNLSEKDNCVKIVKPYLKYLCAIDYGILLTKEHFIKIGETFNKKVEFNLIDSMKLTEILHYFNLAWLYYIAILIGIKDYDVEQYEIII